MDFCGCFFLRGNTTSPTFLTDLVQFPLVFFLRRNLCYLEGNVRYLGFPRETTVFFTCSTNFVPFPYVFPKQKTYVTLVVVVILILVLFFILTAIFMTMYYCIIFVLCMYFLLLELL